VTCVETFATLRIFSRTIDPRGVSDALGIEPTDAISIDPSSKYGPRRETNYWGWCTRSHVNSTDNIAHIAAILEQVRNKKAQLEHLRNSGCETDVCCYWVSGGQGGPSLDPSMMGELSQLGLGIWWDVYFDREREA